LALGVLVLLFVPFELFAGGEKEIPRQRWATFFALGVVGGLCWFLPYADRREWLVWPESDTLRYAGLACAAVGTGIRVAGMIQLGALFSGFVVVQKEHHLVTDGCYRWVRHPIYTGIIIALVATAATEATPMAVLGAVLIAIGLWVKARAEERFLLAELGPGAYESYRHRVPMLIPFVR